MKLIDHPSVFVVARQSVDPAELARYLDTIGVPTWATDTDVPAEKVIELGGRVCYQSFSNPRPGGNDAYIAHIKEVSHGSVLEHGVWTLLITGVSRNLTHELVRHRAGISPSQLSDRYVDKELAGYVCPDVIRTDPDLFREWQDAVYNCRRVYTLCRNKLAMRLGADTVTQEQRTAARKAARQAARSILPGSVETQIMLTANARALRHFLEQRGSVHADPEIRRLAYAVYDVMVKESPALFGDYVQTPDGLTTPYRKV